MDAIATEIKHFPLTTTLKLLNCGRDTLDDLMERSGVTYSKVGKLKAFTEEEVNLLKEAKTRKFWWRDTEPPTKEKSRKKESPPVKKSPNVQPMYVRISRADAHHGETIAKNAVLNHGVKGVRVPSDRSFLKEIDRCALGFKGEVVFARVFDLKPPPIGSLYTDGGVDFWVNNISIDVKTSSRKNPDLLFDSVDNFSSDIACLIEADKEDEDLFIIHGWICRRDFIANAQTLKVGTGKRLYVTSRDLQPIERLWRYLKEHQNDYQTTRAVSARDMRGHRDNCTD